MLSWTECPGQESAANGEMTVEYLTTRQVAAGQEVGDHARPDLQPLVRYESRRQVANTRVGGERVHQSRVGKAPGNEVKVEYSEKSVLATAGQASKEVPAGHLPITPDNGAFPDPSDHRG